MRRRSASCADTARMLAAARSASSRCNNALKLRASLTATPLPSTGSLASDRSASNRSIRPISRSRGANVPYNSVALVAMITANPVASTASSPVVTVEEIDGGATTSRAVAPKKTAPLIKHTFQYKGNGSLTGPLTPRSFQYPCPPFQPPERHHRMGGSTHSDLRQLDENWTSDR